MTMLECKSGNDFVGNSVEKQEKSSSAQVRSHPFPNEGKGWGTQFLAFSSAKRLADFPMVTEGIDDPSHAPAVGLIGDRHDLGRACSDGPSESGVGVANNEDHARRSATEGF